MEKRVSSATWSVNQEILFPLGEKDVKLRIAQVFVDMLSYQSNDPLGGIHATQAKPRFHIGSVNIPSVESDFGDFGNYTNENL